MTWAAAQRIFSPMVAARLAGGGRPDGLDDGCGDGEQTLPNIVSPRWRAVGDKYGRAIWKSDESEVAHGSRWEQ